MLDHAVVEACVPSANAKSFGSIELVGAGVIDPRNIAEREQDDLPMELLDLGPHEEVLGQDGRVVGMAVLYLDQPILEAGISASHFFARGPQQWRPAAG